MKCLFPHCLIVGAILFSCLMIPSCSIYSLKGEFFIHDLNSDSGLKTIDGHTKDFDLQYEKSVHNGAQFFDVNIYDHSGQDHAVVLSWASNCIPTDNLEWLEGLDRNAVVDTNSNYVSQNGDRHPLSFNFGDVGKCVNPLSRYPFAAVTDGKRGYAIGIDMAFPAVFRVGFNGESGKLYIEYDLGFAPEHNDAHLRFCVFQFDPEWGFRGALKRYYEIFPDYFSSHLPQPSQGLWMPAGKISEVQGHEDFGFRFKEVDNEVKFDDENNFLTFKYVEPMTAWVTIDHDIIPERGNKSLAEYKKLEQKVIFDEIDRMAVTDPALKRIRNSVTYLNDGVTPYYGVTDMPWCKGVLFGMNSMPGIKGEYSDFHSDWNEELKEQVFGNTEQNGICDGMYIDSVEGFVAYLDFRREHFSAATTPLTFDRVYRKPAIFRGNITFEYCRAIAEDIHSMGKFMMCNQSPSELCFLAPLFDVMGTETDWNPGGEWKPMELEHMFYRRALCNQKPFCFLQNTNFDNFSKEKMEKFMKRSIAFAMSPGCFSADAANRQYFTVPEYYNRDRDLFKKYVPVCVELSDAGWEVITEAIADDKNIHVERFGKNYLTILNDSQEAITFTLHLCHLSDAVAEDMLTGNAFKWENGNAVITLGAEDVLALKFNKNLD